MKVFPIYRQTLSNLLVWLIILVLLANPVDVLAHPVTAESRLAGSYQSVLAKPVSLNRPCETVNVHIDKIYINEGGDDGFDGDAEWFLDVFINGSHFEFNDDNVDTGETKPDGDTKKFSPRDHRATLLSDTSMIDFQTGGYEEDDNANDLLPSTSWGHGPADNWGIGGQKSKYVQNLEFAYTLFYTISCVSPPFADLSLTMSDSPDPVSGGDTLKYNLTVTNKGPNDVQSVTLIDNLPSGLTYLSANHNGCIPAGSTITCRLGNLPKNGSTSVQITTQVNYITAGNLTNQASVSLSSANKDPNTTNNLTSATTTGPQTPGPLPTRQCGSVNVHIDKIYINAGGDDGTDGDAEWYLDVFINGSQFEFNDDDVDTGETKPDGTSKKFSPKDYTVTLSNDSSTIDFRTGGYEDDDSGDDPLPSGSWSHRQADNWGIGTQRSKYVSNSVFGYTVYYTISCASPAVYYSFLPIIIK